MGSQLAQNGDIGLVADLAGLTIPFGGAGAPGETGVYPSQYAVNTTTNHVYINQTGTNWTDLGALSTTPAQANRYLALLSADPVANLDIAISDLTELTTGNCPSYSRQSVAFGNFQNTYPSSCSNTGVVTWTNIGPMTVPAQWVGLVTVASGSTGWFLASWALVSPIQVLSVQSVQIGVGQLVLQGN